MERNLESVFDNRLLYIVDKYVATLKGAYLLEKGLIEPDDYNGMEYESIRSWADLKKEIIGAYNNGTYFDFEELFFEYELYMDKAYSVNSTYDFSKKKRIGLDPKYFYGICNYAEAKQGVCDQRLLKYEFSAICLLAAQISSLEQELKSGTTKHESYLELSRRWSRKPKYSDGTIAEEQASYNTLG